MHVVLCFPAVKAKLHFREFSCWVQERAIDGLWSNIRRGQIVIVFSEAVDKIWSCCANVCSRVSILACPLLVVNWIMTVGAETTGLEQANLR